MNTDVARVVALLAPSALVGGPPPASAEQTTVLTEDLCTTCSIELTADVLLGTDGESVIGMAWDIQRLSDGRFTMAFGNLAAWPEFTVFSADGSDFRRIGRDGEGPGEYIRVLSVRERGEELFVLDNHRRRITVLDPDFDVVRTVPLGCLICNGFDMAMLPGGRMALNYFMSTGSLEEALAADAGFAVHVLGPDGESLHSVDEIPARSPMNPARDPSRFLDVAPDGSLLSLHLTSYRIDRWDPATGELLQTFERGADWFPDGQSSGHSARPDRPPTTGTRAMHVDEAGRVWVQIGRPAPDWEDRLERTGPDAHPEEGDWRYGPGSTEGVIEVLDLESGRVLFSQVLDSEVLGGWGKLFAPGWLAVYDEEGIPQYRMWRLRLEGEPGRNDRVDGSLIVSPTSSRSRLTTPPRRCCPCRSSFRSSHSRTPCPRASGERSRAPRSARRFPPPSR